MSRKIEVELVTEEQQVNDAFYILVYVKFRKQKHLLTRVQKVIAKDTGKLLGYNLDGDHFSSFENVLNRLETRIVINLTTDTDSLD
jgi:hypothetical protein